MSGHPSRHHTQQKGIPMYLLPVLFALFLAFGALPALAQGTAGTPPILTAIPPCDTTKHTMFISPQMGVGGSGALLNFSFDYANCDFLNTAGGYAIVGLPPHLRGKTKAEAEKLARDFAALVEGATQEELLQALKIFGSPKTRAALISMLQAGLRDGPQNEVADGYGTVGDKWKKPVKKK